MRSIQSKIDHEHRDLLNKNRSARCKYLDRSVQIARIIFIVGITMITWQQCKESKRKIRTQHLRYNCNIYITVIFQCEHSSNETNFDLIVQ